MTTNITTEKGAEAFIPLNKLRKSPRNARKTPHSEASLEAYAASIAAKGILENLVVEPELDANGKKTGFHLVTSGEGPGVRREGLARLQNRNRLKTGSRHGLRDIPARHEAWGFLHGKW